MIEKNDTELAIDGGPAAISIEIPNWPPVWPAVCESVNQSLADGSWGRYHGPPIDDFVNSFDRMLGGARIWPCSSGTVAVELALRGCGVKANDEVILAGYDFPGNFRAIESIAARPVLIDVRENGFVIDPEFLLPVITPQTRAIIVSHLHGQLADVAAIRQICQSNSIAVVEDACQVPGATIDGHPAGMQGDVGVFSFGGSKLLTAGRGGAVATRDESNFQRIRIAAERGNDAYPLSTIQAAALTPQLKILDETNRQRLKSAIRLRDALAGSRLFRPVADPWNSNWSPAFYKFALQIPSAIQRQPVVDALQAEGVPADTGFRGFSRRSARRCSKPSSLDNSVQAAEQTILLHHPFLLGADALLDQIVTALQKVEARLAST